MFFRFSFHLLRKNRTIVFAVVFAKFYGLVNLSLSISDWFSHLKGYCFSNFLESFLNTVSNISDKFGSLLNSSVSVNLISRSRSLKFDMEILVAYKFEGFFELTCKWIFRYDLSHFIKS